MSYRYVIHCAQMHREEAFVAKDLYDLMKWIEQYTAHYGPIDLLYNTGRA